MKNKYFVSIIVPVYNMQNCIRVCLDSILSQSYDNYEVIIIDDGSSDGTRNEIEYFLEIDKRFKYFYIENMGVSAARNVGIERTQGDYICFVDPDDYLHPYYIEKLLDALVRNSCDVVICHFEAIQNENPQTILDRDNILSQMIYKQDQIMELFNKYHNSYLMGYVWNKIYSKKAIQDTRFIVNCRYQDMYFNLEIMQKIYSVSIIKDKLYYYKILPESGVHSQSERIELFIDWCNMREFELEVFKKLKNTKLFDHKIQCTLNSLDDNLNKFKSNGYTKCQEYCMKIIDKFINKYIFLEV